SILISTVNGDQEIACDSVILSVGYTPDQSLYRPKTDTKKGGKTDGDTSIHVLGDAQAVGNLKKAIWGAYDLGVRL
ncbi:MAG: 2-enoate reductase, partial [Ruminococcus sp.]|nr:2-enoate reductase [Ruminococcus sp.]